MGTYIAMAVFYVWVVWLVAHMCALSEQPDQEEVEQP